MTTGWMGSGSDCYSNSIATTVPSLVIGDLQGLSLWGETTGGMDEVILSCDSSVVAMCGSPPGGDLNATGQDSVLGLEGAWTTAEFNVFGNGSSSQATFNDPGSTIVVKTSVVDGTTNPPLCLQERFTLETNNLSLVTPCCHYGGASPAIEFMETNAGHTATCGVSAIVGDTHITTTNGAHYNFQSAGEFVSLRDSNGDEIQRRQAPISTTFIGTYPYDGLTTCVSLNTAVAVHVGEHRVTYEPNLGGVPDPSGLATAHRWCSCHARPPRQGSWKWRSRSQVCNGRRSGN